ncbi:glycosyltransferase family 2 protein [Fuerstiella marisgermanici]|uniref:Undecaprenyl-phosphate 4-deoxy-4-formamido-L-arabinose transferase n=1 Tax=Fuerstiella marisgermanici TaxID=1891926 RepID=A0A1P8WDC4_9PLAN|nr:glycosyltransferase family 2 protein [Fuerstiella marisgermanici]APZ92063.1 Undecaprenyl-phosphate 4-deoxy-4-formamido-L-arabinose transferase [Fuerstiella marisgermanici]
MYERTLTALPVYNEANHVPDVLNQVLQHADDVLVVNDGSTDGTSAALAAFEDRVHVETHSVNRGYGAALKTAFDYAVRYGYDVLVTIDCDGQHQPQLISEIAQLVGDPANPVDMVSGSRYLQPTAQVGVAPEDRRRINMQITRCLNEQLGFNITDAFCGFKAYRVSSLADLDITDHGYAMPLQLWVQAADLNWKISEFPTPLVYLDEDRSFGGSLDDAAVRLAHYRSVLNAELSRRGMHQRFTADCGKSGA